METFKALKELEGVPFEDPNVSKKIQFKQGIYSLHAYIEEARSLVPPENRSTSDPVFTVSAFGINKSSKVHEKIGCTSRIPIHEHMFITAQDRTGDDIITDRVTISVNDNGIFKKCLMGLHEIDLTYIYSNPDHCIHHRWVVLTNPEERNFGLTRGYIKLSISLLHEKDHPVNLTTKEDPNSIDKDLLIPPHIKPKTVQLNIILLKAESLPIMDIGDTVDAYCIARFAGAECKSSVYTADKATLSVYWYDKILLPVLIPCVSSNLSLVFYDKDLITDDELIGAIHLNFDDIYTGKYNIFFWANIYGAPPLSEGEVADYMNKVPSIASHWRGRVLLKVWVDQDEKNKKKGQRSKISKEIYKKCIKIYDEDKGIQERLSTEFETGEEYEMRTQIFTASSLPFKQGQYLIRVEWSGVHVESSIKEATDGIIDWFETCRRKVALIPAGAEQVLPDLFVYLVLGDKKICFVRIPVRELGKKSNEGCWRQFTPDITEGTVEHVWNAGFIKVRIYVGPYDSKHDDVSNFNWDSIKPPEFKPWKLYLHLFQCRDLPAADKNGLADPYVTLHCLGNEISTIDSPIECTLNPRWYKTYDLTIDMSSPQDSAPMIVYVYDFDEIGSDDLLGYVAVDMTEAVVEPKAVPRPKWKKLSLGRVGTEHGEILMSFSLSKDVKIQHKFEITPVFVEKNVEINMLGLRDLKPAIGWLPVNKAYVRFDLSSLSLPGESTGIRIIETQPFDIGNSPNIATTVSFKCKFPLDASLSPVLTATVNDYLFAGLSQPLIGSISINLAKYMNKYFIEGAEINEPFSQNLRSKSRNLSLVDEPGKIKWKPSADSKCIHIEEHMEEQKFIEDTEIEEEKEEEKIEISMREVNEMSNLVSEIDELTFEEICEDQTKIVIKAMFKVTPKKVVEVRVPSPVSYLPVGYNRVPGDKFKKYRYYISKPLEDTFLFNVLPFEEMDIFRGQARGADDNFLNFDSHMESNGELTTHKCVGKLKAFIRITDYPPPEENAEDEFSQISRLLIIKTSCTVRIYIIDAFDLESKDNASSSDPYLKLKLGDKKKNDKKNFQENQNNPKFYKVFEMITVLPGKSMLQIQMWDHNSLLPDVKIGTTRIDLEDRFFNKKWLDLKKKPIETRPLYLKNHRMPQGFLRLWLEIHPGHPRKPAKDISQRPPGIFEARLIIWKAKEVPSQDMEDLNDLYVLARINDQIEKETDTHYRAAYGHGSWNWRLKFSLTLPQPSNILTLQLWDRDLITSNDFISEVSIDFSSMAQEAWENDTTVQKFGESDNSKDIASGKESEIFWVQCKKRKQDGREADCGKILISFELMPKRRAENFMVGEGREKPNMNPYLPPPLGRFRFSWNPFSMLGQMVGPAVKKKLCCALCCALICLLILGVGPLIFSYKISEEMPN